MFDQNASTNMQVTSRLSTDSVIHDLNVARNAQIQGYDANGFDFFLRGNTGTALSTHYMAVKLNGLSATLINSASPTATGNHSIGSAGFTPQFGFMLHGEFAAVNTDYGIDDGEVWGLSAFTASDAFTTSIYSEDSDGTSNTESVTDTKPVRLRKDNADYMTATFSTFTSDGATFNYSTVPAAAKQRSVLFIQAQTSVTLASDSGSYLLTGTASVLRPGSVTILEHRR
jgi:hypothetical protein